ncbi:MAG TPA: cohesin domain-containing protein [Candidatus Polarisedimenticolia bacterium]|nr:cohesin domain-containing protein [Candidatus Polarisedimenticolia bacterium]
MMGTRVLLCFVLALTLASCGGDRGGTGGSDAGIAMTFTPPGPGQDLLWIADGGRAGGLQFADVLVRDVTLPFDAYQIEITFDPLVLAAAGFSSGHILDACSQQVPLEADNITNGQIGSSGRAVFSAAAPAGTGCTVAGTRLLARIAFSPLGGGESAVRFLAYNDDPGAPEGSRLLSLPDALPVPVEFFDSAAVISVDM